MKVLGGQVHHQGAAWPVAMSGMPAEAEAPHPRHPAKGRHRLALMVLRASQQSR